MTSYVFAPINLTRNRSFIDVITTALHIITHEIIFIYNYYLKTKRTTVIVLYVQVCATEYKFLGVNRKYSSRQVCADVVFSVLRVYKTIIIMLRSIKNVSGSRPVVFKYKFPMLFKLYLSGTNDVYQTFRI